MNLRKLIRIEADTLEELRQATAEAAEAAVAYLGVEGTTRAKAVDKLRAISESLQDEVTQIIITARDNAASLAYNEIIIEARNLDIEEPSEADEDTETEGRALAAGFALASAWLLVMLLAGKRNAKKVSRLQDFRLRRLAATEVAQAYGTASQRIYKLLDKFDKRLVMKRWDATLDMKTCRVCRELHGTEVRITESFPGGATPGNEHPHCRCVSTLVSASESQAA